MTNSVNGVYNIVRQIITRGIQVKDLSWEEFQDTVAGCLVRHKSIIDARKIHETSARVNRAVSKSVTSCGCIQINAKQ